MRIVLVEPEIPQNAGNVSRTCVLTGSELHLVEPLGFSLEEKYLKRAGLDYWKHLDLNVHQNWEEFLNYYRYFQQGRLLFFSTKGSGYYSEITFHKEDWLIFGSETSGLPGWLIESYSEIYRIPMRRDIKRSLNLSNTVAVVVYEAMRQLGYPGMD